MLLAGPSKAGKTSFASNLINYRDVMFDVIPQRVIWISTTTGQTAIEGVSYTSDLNISPAPYDLIIIDDMMTEAQNSTEVTYMFTKIAHHTPCFVIFISQNLFQHGTHARTRSLNAHYIVIFKNPRDQTQIAILGRQMFPHLPKFLSNAYQDATSKAFSYLFVDLNQDTPQEIRVRSNILPNETPHYVYCPRS